MRMVQYDIVYNERERGRFTWEHRRRTMHRLEKVPTTRAHVFVHFISNRLSIGFPFSRGNSPAHSKEHTPGYATKKVGKLAFGYSVSGARSGPTNVEVQFRNVGCGFLSCATNPGKGPLRLSSFSKLNYVTDLVDGEFLKRATFWNTIRQSSPLRADISIPTSWTHLNLKRLEITGISPQINRKGNSGDARRASCASPSRQFLTGKMFHSWKRVSDNRKCKGL